MTTLPVTVNKVPADIGVALSAAIEAENPVGPMSMRGRGRVRLFNSSGNARLYVGVQDTAPDASVPGVLVRPGAWWLPDEDLEITPAGGVWAWSNRDGAKITALVTAWS